MGGRLKFITYCCSLLSAARKMLISDQRTTENSLSRDVKDEQTAADRTRRRHLQ